MILFIKAFTTEAFFVLHYCMTENEISFTFKGRYYKLGEISPLTKQIWFVLHGYGQLAQYFIQKFKVLEEHGICVIAPEGLSRFYLEQLQTNGRKSNRVGATWMTRENRLTDIENYIEFLNSIYEKEFQDLAIPVTVVGFSQGSATASRWLITGKIKFDRLILWAGIFPPDMDFESGSKVLKDKEVILVYGKNDAFLSDERFAEMKLLTEKLNTTIREITFDGGHEIDSATLVNLLREN
jgi:predicted esterase